MYVTLVVCMCTLYTARAATLYSRTAVMCDDLWYMFAVWWSANCRASLLHNGASCLTILSPCGYFSRLWLWPHSSYLRLTPSLRRCHILPTMVVVSSDSQQNTIKYIHNWTTVVQLSGQLQACQWIMSRKYKQARANHKYKLVDVVHWNESKERYLKVKVSFTIPWPVDLRSVVAT